MIRAGRNHYKFSSHLNDRLNHILDDYETDLDEMWKEFHSLPTVLGRLEKTGVVNRDLALSIGAVGMCARASAVMRDIRMSHPYGLYNQFSPISIVKHHGDVYSRTKLRYDEIVQSLYYIRKLLKRMPSNHDGRQSLTSLKRETLALSLTEGWRGEICHCAITDHNANLMHYKVKDPSAHNWLALAMAVRNNEISDFPICNKSFDLSYCGHDL